MARRSLLAEVIRAQEQRRRAQERTQREWGIAQRRAEQEMQRAERDATRQAAADGRERERLLHEDGTASAERLSREVEQRMAALNGLLVAALGSQQGLSFAAMRQRPRAATFSPRPDLLPSPPPQWEQFAPLSPAPTGLSARFGGKTRYEQQIALAQHNYAQAMANYQRAEGDRQARLAQARANFENAANAERAEVARHNAEVDALETGFQAGETEVVEDCFSLLLARSGYPADFPDDRRVAYRPEPRELWVEVELPDRTVVPEERGFRYVKTRKQIDTLPRPEREVKQTYASVVAQTALRTLYECFSVDARGLVDTVVFNGHLSTRDPATGSPIHPCLVSVSANRETFDGFELAHLDPVACLKHLNALVSSHPYDLESVEPVVDFDKAKFKFTDEFDAAAELDGRYDLLKMDPYKFEQLIRQLFEKIGMKSWVTQPSRDDGIDGVAINEDPILGGVCVIQAKRYKRVVEADAVRALWGAMEDKQATTGILVTTSWFGSTGRQFAANHRERLRLIEGAELKHLLAEHLQLDVRIGLDRPPPRRR
ncbi:restriction endonuclease [Fodinicola feengrottensis]|uniref:Restriction endonuclease n=2 Tax=Fodinicola feengrottensis TaxID=435914 RepID=A0ABP4SEW5_9ACTN